MRGHEIVVDQPLEDGGGDAGPSPSELWVASLGACVGYFAGRFMSRHSIDAKGLGVDIHYDYSTDLPSRVGSIALKVILPPGFPQSQLAALHRVAESCTVHNSIKRAPEVKIALEEAATAA